MNPCRDRPRVLGKLHHVVTGLFHAGDVGMLAERRHRIGQQVHARVHRDVVEKHRHGRSIGDIGIVANEHVARHLALEERGCANEHRVDAKVGGSTRGRDRGGGGFAPRAGKQGSTRWHRAPHYRDRPIGFVVFQLRRFAVGSKNHQTGERRAHVTFDVRAQAGLVESTGRCERSDQGRIDAGEASHRQDFSSAD